MKQAFLGQSPGNVVGVIDGTGLSHSNVVRVTDGFSQPALQLAAQYRTLAIAIQTILAYQNDSRLASNNLLI